MEIYEKIRVMQFVFAFFMGLLGQVSQGFQPGDVLLTLVVLVGLAVLSLLKENPLEQRLVGGCLLVSVFFYPALGVYLPVLFFVYAGYWKETLWLEPLLTGATLVYALQNNLLLLAAAMLLLAQSFLLNIFLWKLADFYQNYRALEDLSFERQKNLEDKNKILVQRQDQLLTLEISNERNRIARDIHDNVGHLLSSALLQIAAAETLNRDPNLEEPFRQLRQTLNTGMNNIRESVHDLHDDSLKLSQSVHDIVRQFTFCALEIEGELPDYLAENYNLTLLAVLKEGLNNIMKHSNADLVTIKFQTFPAFYKLTIQDNGDSAGAKQKNERGMGLESLQSRIEKLQGHFSIIKTKTNYTIIAVLPKRHEKSG